MHLRSTEVRMTEEQTSRTRGAQALRGGSPREEVEELLKRFARALTSGRGRDIAAMWEIPALVVADDSVRALTSSDEVAAIFGAAKERYNERGVVDTHPDVLRIEWLTEQIVVTEVRWPHILADGEILTAETSTYTLRRDDSGTLRFRVAVMQGISDEPPEE
jgi:hypothetical protein